jgi:hypothetical protein
MGDARAEFEDPTERRVARALILNWATTGDGLAANLARVRRTSPQERHDLWARACRAVGVETPDERRERESYTPLIREYPPLPTCHVCGDFPRDNMGHPDPNFARVKRWHCSAHEHLADPGDMNPPPPPQFDPSVPFTPEEIERMKRQDARIQQAQRERNEQRKLRARELAEEQKIRDREIGEGLSGAPR